MSASTRFCTILAKAVSMSRLVPALTISIFRPIVAAAVLRVLNQGLGCNRIVGIDEHGEARRSRQQL